MLPTYSSSSTSTISTLSSSSSTSSAPAPPAMDDVWKDITLSSSTPTFSSNDNDNQIVLQDFLSTANPTLTSRVGRAAAVFYQNTQNHLAVVVPLPMTALSLNSGAPDFCFLDDQTVGGDGVEHGGNNNMRDVRGPNFDVGLEGFSPSGTFMGSFGRKRFSEEAEMGSEDRRHKRMIKNRESAARSRARKQEIYISLSPFVHVYVSELQQEIAQLREENKRLWTQQQEQHQQLSFGCWDSLVAFTFHGHGKGTGCTNGLKLPVQVPPVAILQVPKKQRKPLRLQRALTAPF
ncbi:FD-like protein [Drosera capensis]